MTPEDTVPGLDDEEQKLFIRELSISPALGATDRRIEEHEQREGAWFEGQREERKRLMELDRQVTKVIRQASNLRASIRRQLGYMAAKKYPKVRELARLRGQRTRIVKTIGSIVAGKIAKKRQAEAYSTLIKSHALHKKRDTEDISGPQDGDLPRPHSYPAREEKVISGHEDQGAS